MLKRTFLFLTAALLCWGPLGADRFNLIIWGTDGSQLTSYQMLERPSVRFSGTRLVVDAMGLEVAYELDKVSKFTYEDLTTSIGQTGGEASGRFTMVDETLRFAASGRPLRVAVRTAGGKTLAEETLPAGAKLDFPLGGLPTGVYLVSLDGVTYKILKR